MIWLVLAACGPKHAPVPPTCEIHDRLAEGGVQTPWWASIIFVDATGCPAEVARQFAGPTVDAKSVDLRYIGHRDYDIAWIRYHGVLTALADDFTIELLAPGVAGETHTASGTTYALPPHWPTEEAPDWWPRIDGAQGALIWSQRPAAYDCPIGPGTGALGFQSDGDLYLWVWSVDMFGGCGG